MDSGLYGFLGAFVTAAGLYLGNRFMAKQQHRTSLESSIYDRLRTLEDRVDRLEKERDDLQSVQLSFVVHIERLYAWLADGCPGKRPQLPMKLRTLIDPVYWKHEVPDPEDLLE